MASVMQNEFVSSMAVYNSRLYVGTWSFFGSTEVWRCSVCDNTDWSQVNTDGFGDANNESARMAVYNNRLYVGTSNGSTGAEIWELVVLPGAPDEGVTSGSVLRTPGPGDSPGSPAP